MSAPIFPAPRTSTRCIGNSPGKGVGILPIPGPINHPAAALFLQCNQSVYDDPAMNVAVESGVWSPDSWQRFPALQQPAYRDPARLARVLGELARLPPIVVSWEVDQLREELAAAQRGERFLLQGGDCAEGFADCDSDTIARKLK